MRQIVRDNIVTANTEERDKAIKQKAIYKKYMALVHEIGEHPASHEISSKSPALYGAIWYLWGGMKNFRNHYGILRERKNTEEKSTGEKII